MTYVPLSIYFTQRQWYLYKRFLIRNALNEDEKAYYKSRYRLTKIYFRLLLWVTITLIAGYAILYGYYIYYVELVTPCKEDADQCPILQWIALSSLIL